MSASRRTFTQDFKDDLCREVLSASKPFVEVAQAYGVGPGTLRRWLLKSLETQGITETSATGAELSRLKDLEKENQDLRAENLFLKSGAGKRGCSGHPRQCQAGGCG